MLTLRVTLIETNYLQVAKIYKKTSVNQKNKHKHISNNPQKTKRKLILTNSI